MNKSNVTRRTAMRVAIAGAAAAAGAVRAPRQGASNMERVQGIGGFFFRAKDPKNLATWYETNLGVTRVPDNYDTLPWRTGAGTTIFAPFKEDTSYFGDEQVIDVDCALVDRRAPAGGGTVAGLSSGPGPESEPELARFEDRTVDRGSGEQRNRVDAAAAIEGGACAVPI